MTTDTSKKTVNANDARTTSQLQQWFADNEGPSSKKNTSLIWLKARKILCVCEVGSSRSVACAFVLRAKYQADALACGWKFNSEDTLRMLCAWADGIIVMQQRMQQQIPDTFQEKVLVVDVGPDLWYNSLHPELLTKVDLLLLDKLNSSESTSIFKPNS